jgi:hypothetical protein
MLRVPTWAAHGRPCLLAMSRIGNFFREPSEGALAGLRRGPPNRHAQASGKPAIVHLKVDPEAITPATTLTKLREQKSLVA